MQRYTCVLSYFSVVTKGNKPPKRKKERRKKSKRKRKRNDQRQSLSISAFHMKTLIGLEKPRVKIQARPCVSIEYTAELSPSIDCHIIRQPNEI